MTTTVWQQVDELFALAAEHAPADVEEVVVAACGDNSELREEVLSLLVHAGSDDLEEFVPRLLDSIVGEGDGKLDSQQQLGPYVLEAEIGRGGMGVVYRARDVELGRDVALKTILGGRLAGTTAVERFYAEARAASNIDHPNIVPVYRVAQYGDVHCFSMALVEGGSLAERLGKERFGEREAVELVKTLAEAVDFAHRQGVVHRDLKPANILLDAKGNPRITDFGLALRDAVGDRLTATGEVVGTVAYMSPEQARGEADLVGPHSDQYSLGVVLYELLTGQTPFLGRDHKLLQQVANDEPPPARDANPAISKELEAICLRAMDRQLEQRYPSVGQLAEDLGRLLAGEPVTAKPVSRAAKMLRLARKQLRKPWVAAVVTAVFVIAALWLTSNPFVQPQLNPLSAGTNPAQPPEVSAVLASTDGTLSAQRATSRRNIEQLGVAVSTYNQVWRTLMPAVIVDKDGRPTLSWRVAILPFLGQEELFERFNKEQPWDSPHNAKLLTEMPSVFAVAGRQDVPHSTYYQVVTGPGTAFDFERRGKIRHGNILDGHPNTFMLVEARSAVPWTQPVDVEFVPGVPPPNLGGLFEDGFHAVMFDGSVCFLSQAIHDTPDHLSALMQVSDRRLVPLLEYVLPEELDIPAQMALSERNLKQLAVAIHNYHDVYRRTPPPFTADAAGEPLLSWRVAILPLVGYGVLHDRFRLDEPWDSPHNKALLPMMPTIFASPRPGKADRDETFYQAFTGAGAVFDPSPGARVRWNDVDDGLSKTLLLVEARDPVPWTKPQDVPYRPDEPIAELGGIFREGFHACTADAEVDFFSRDLLGDEDSMRALIQYDDGKDVRTERYQLSGEPLRALVDGATRQDGLKPYVVKMELERREEAARKSRSNLNELALAMHGFHDNARRLPPPATRASDGKPLLSWRVALLPYLDEQNLYDLFHQDEAWDSQHNKKLLSRMPAIFRHPTAGPEESDTFYQLLTGPGTAYEPDQPGPRLHRDILDGTHHTMMIVEAEQPVPWTKPADLVYDPAAPVPKLGGVFREGFHAAMFSGDISFLFREICQDEPALRALIEVDNGVLVDISRYIRR